MINGHGHWVLSGGIGSGKSSVRRLLEAAGWHGVDADSIGHEVLEPRGPAFAAVAQRWPGVVTGGRIDRAALGRIVFGSPDELEALEKLTHPHIFGRILSRIEGIEESVVVEVPLLRFSLKGDWRRIIVDCDDATKLDRLIAKGLSRTEAEDRMRSQPSRSEWLVVADVIIPNHGGLEELTATVGSLLA